MLATFLICLLILYIPAGGGQPAFDWGWTLLGVGALAGVNALAAWLGSRVARRLCDGAAPRGPERAMRVLKAMNLMVAGLVGVEAYALLWPRAVTELLDPMPAVPLVGHLLLLAPALVMMVTTMAFQHALNRARGRTPLSLGRYLALRFRTELAILLAPLLALALMSDVVWAIWADSPHYEMIEYLLTISLAAGLMFFGPWALRLIWRTSPLPPGPLRERLAALSSRERFRCSDILVWHTHGRLPNAAVIGFLPWTRYVMITDALLDELTAAEIEGVFAHEVAHVKQRHLWFYLLFVLAFIAFLPTFLDLAASVGLIQRSHGVMTQDLTGGQTAVALVSAGLYWVVAFGYVSRRLEQQADLFALRSCRDPSAFISALRKLAALSGVPAAISSWRHFSVSRRTAFLEAVLQRPHLARQARRRAILMQLAFLALLASAILHVVA